MNRSDLHPTVKMRLQSGKRREESLTDAAADSFPKMTPRQLRRLRRAVKFERNLRTDGIEAARTRQRRARPQVTDSRVVSASLGAVYPSNPYGSTRYVPTSREIDDMTVARDICDHERLSPLDGARPAFVARGRSNDYKLGNSAGRRVQPNNRI